MFELCYTHAFGHPDQILDSSLCMHEWVITFQEEKGIMTFWKAMELHILYITYLELEINYLGILTSKITAASDRVSEEMNG